MSNLVVKQTDLLPAVEFICKETDGTAYNLTGAQSITWKMRLKGSTELVVNSAATATDAAAGKGQYAWAEGDTDTAGTYECVVRVVEASGKPRTFPTKGFAEIAIDENL